MLLVAALAPFVVLATRVIAHPNALRDSLNSLPITKHINSNGTSSPVPRGRKRWTKLAKDDQQPTVEVPLNDTAINYVVNIGIGDPPTYYNLIVDTGSGNIWLGANKPYNKTKTSVKTSDIFNITYGKGFALGIEYEDTVTIAPGVAIRQSIGVASNSSDIYPYDGIFGIGSKNLTHGTLSPDNTSVIPTVTDNLYEQGKIEQNLVAVSFEPTTSQSVINGELAFGGTDPNKYTGDITYFPITNTTSARDYWAVDTSLRYGNACILNTTASVVDTGTSLIGLPTDAYNSYVSATGAVQDNNTGLLHITPAQYTNLQSLFFDIGGRTYELTPNAQIFPRALNADTGGETSSIYLVSYDSGPDVSNAVNFIVGKAFLERFYSVFDTSNRRVGLATTAFTYADIN